MPAPAPLVCLITPGHLASTPRLIKEADALAGAGYRVHVVAGRHFPPAEPLDEAILRAARWSCTRLDFRPGRTALTRQLGRRLARLLVANLPSASARLAARAHHAQSRHFARVAAGLRADLYLGHCLAGLSAAAIAADTVRTRYGFDAEDFHDAETEAALADRTEAAARRLVQQGHLPGCVHFTASSPLIGRQYENAYGTRPPAIVLNVFPRAHAPAAPVDPGPVSADRPARCYWFSQTVGPGRGLEAAVQVLARLRTPVELQLRGFASADFKTTLQAAATRAGLARPIVFLPPGPPDEMARLAATADLGLSLEESTPLNRALCLTNKIFVYLLAGIPQLLSTTAAQRSLAPDLGPAGWCGELARPEEVAAGLDGFFSSPTRMAEARRTAWELAQRRYCWDIEQQVFLKSIASALVSRS